MDQEQYFQTWKRIKGEIRRCERQMRSAANFLEITALRSEMAALEAESEWRDAQFALQDFMERVARIYEAYGELGLNEKNYMEYLYEEGAGDEFDWIKARDFLEPMINPNRVNVDLRKLEMEVEPRERQWTEKLEIWERSYELWQDKFGRKALADTEVIAFHVLEGEVKVALQRTDGSWTHVGGLTYLPSGIYVARLDKWAEILGELEELINAPNVREGDLQRFFERHPELLQGKEYDIVIPQACIVSDHDHEWRADFVLCPIDQISFCKVLEIKVPHLPIERMDWSGHDRFFTKLYQAINQVRDYAEAFSNSETRRRFRQRYGVDVYRPLAQLVVGRRDHIKGRHSIHDLQARNLVEITDWDTYLDRLRRQFT